MRHTPELVDIKIRPEYGISRQEFTALIPKKGAHRLSLFSNSYLSVPIEFYLYLSDSDKQRVEVKNLPDKYKPRTKQLKEEPSPVKKVVVKSDDKPTASSSLEEIKTWLAENRPELKIKPTATKAKLLSLIQ